MARVHCNSTKYTWGVRCISKIPSMGCDEQEETNGSVILQGGKAWNLPELSPVTLASLNLTKDE